MADSETKATWRYEVRGSVLYDNVTGESLDIVQAGERLNGFMVDVAAGPWRVISQDGLLYITDGTKKYVTDNYDGDMNILCWRLNNLEAAAAERDMLRIECQAYQEFLDRICKLTGAEHYLDATLKVEALTSKQDTQEGSG